MIADINDGSGPKLVKYIHLTGDAVFEVNEILCYEKPRLMPSDFAYFIRGGSSSTTMPSYIPARDGPLLNSNCVNESTDDELTLQFHDG